VKKIQFLSSLATSAVVIAMIAWGGTLHAQSTNPNTPNTPDTQQQQQQAPDTTPQPTPQSSTPQSPDTSAPSQAQPPANTPDSGAKQGNSSADPAASGAASETQTFTGTVVNQGGKYVLRDDAGKTYDVDAQDQMKKFDGKRVRIHGQLDPTGSTIVVK
jgi:cytoskeletal protein RodZ